MTALNPTPDLELSLAKEKAGDFEWAFGRLIEILEEETRQFHPAKRDQILELLETSMNRLQEENILRKAEANRRFNHENAPT